MRVEPAQLQPIHDAYQQGKLLHAYDLSKSIGPIKSWRGPGARVMAGRLALNLGAPKLGHTLHWLAYREDPGDPEAIYFAGLRMFDHRGPLPTWRFMQHHGELPLAPAKTRADWLALHARVLSAFRDFSTAEKWMKRAEEIAPDRAWICVERAGLLEREDRYTEALAAAKRSLELHPWYRPGVQDMAHLLELLNRDDEALALLREAAERLENAPVVMQLATLESELKQYDVARKSWERVVELSPLLEKEFEKWLCARRSDAAYYCGDFAAAAELADKTDNPFHKEIAPRLRENKGLGKRVILPVGFVRQHHFTCAPATLSTISRFWSMPAEHLEVAEEICYDGTPAHSERNWAEQSGYSAREFTVTWDTTVALIDRGMPFTFTTVEPGMGHLQAVIGYDEARKTLIIRDPYQRAQGEFLADATFERYASTGPRGMTLAPRDRATALCDGVPLPDAELYDQFYEVQRALAAHERDRARTICDRMRETAAKHRLTLWARRSLAGYDANWSESLAALDELIELFPKDINLKLSKLDSLRALARREERMTLLKDASTAKDTDPLLWLMYAQELKEDARENDHAMRWLKRALKFRRADAGVLRAMADILWEQRKTRAATELYRFAACLADKDENLSRTYFLAARHLKETPVALQMMRDRFTRYGRQSSYAARSLFWAHEQLEQITQGFATLDEALLMRPQDGDLRLFAASAHARYGHYEQAGKLLNSAKGKTSEMLWTRCAAEIASLRGDAEEALKLWTHVAAAEPLAMDANGNAARLIAETQSPAAAITYLQAAADRFPHNYPLNQLWLQWVTGEKGHAAAEPVIRRLIAINPADGWSRRELVASLIEQNRLAEALDEAQAAAHVDPSNPSSYFFVGRALTRLDRLDEAREAFKSAIGISVDADYVIGELMMSCDNIAQRKEALAFVLRELEKQTIFGDGLLAYRSHARDVLDAEELLASLRQALDARPDLWHAWDAVGMQLADMGRYEEAQKIISEGTKRFPLLPRIWLDLAAVYRALNQPTDEMAALRTAIEINPAWGEAIRQLAEVHERLGEFSKSRELLEKAIRRTPRDPYNHGYLADLLWRQNERESALKRIEHAVKLEPGYSWGWEVLGWWAAELKRPELAEQIARELTASRSGEARSWLMLARTLRSPDKLEERLTALGKAIELNPRNIDAYDMRARLLAEARRFDEAIAACKPAEWDSHPPARLRARAAWIEAERYNVDEAISQMQKVLDEEPNMYWGWSCLAGWYRYQDAKADFLAAAERMHLLWPMDRVAMGMLGQARLVNGDRAGAREILTSAMERFPDYDYAVETLFTLALEDNKRDDATRCLNLMRRHAPPAYALSREVRFNAHFGDGEATEKAMRALVVHESADDDLVQQAADAMANARMAEALNTILSEALHDPKVIPCVGALHIRNGAKLGRWWHAGRIVDKIADRGEVGRRAVMEYLVQLGGAGVGRKGEVNRLIRRKRDLLRADTHLWGWVGYALIGTQQYRKTAKWSADWRNRQNLEAWMLVNAAAGFRAIRKDAEAHAINEAGVKIPEAGHAHNIHVLWLAADAALANDWTRADDLVKSVEPKEMKTNYQFVHAIVGALVAAHHHAPYKSVQSHLATATLAHAGFRGDPSLRRLRRRALWTLMRIHGGVFRRLAYLLMLVSN